MKALTRSDIATYIRCERKFHYKCVQNLPEGPSTKNMSEGTLLHHGLAEMYRSQSLSDAMTALDDMARSGKYTYHDEEKDLARDACESETVNRLCDVLAFYHQHAFAATMAGKEVYAIEKPFEYELFGIDGTFDLVLRHLDRPVFEVHDFKTVSLVSTALKFLALDTQMLQYEVLANRALGPREVRDPLGNPIGKAQIEMVYNIIRREVPPGFGSRPLTTKSGAKSSASQNVEDYLYQHRFAHSEAEVEYIEDAFVKTTLAAQTIYSLNASHAFIQRRTIKTGGEACHTSCPYFARCCAELIGHAEPNFVPTVISDAE